MTRHNRCPITASERADRRRFVASTAPPWRRTLKRAVRPIREFFYSRVPASRRGLFRRLIKPILNKWGYGPASGAAAMPSGHEIVQSGRRRRCGSTCGSWRHASRPTGRAAVSSEDLYYRLNVVSLTPALLRARRRTFTADRHFRANWAKRGRGPSRWTPGCGTLATTGRATSASSERA